MNTSRALGLASTLFAGALLALSLLGALVTFRDGDTEGFVSALFGIYLTGFLLAGLLRDEMQTRDWQLAFFGGVAVWGGYEYASDGDLFSLLLAVAGVVMVATNLLGSR